MASKAVMLRGEPNVDEQNAASAAITPGMLIEKNSGQWRPHATAGGAAHKVFALERDELGNDMDTAYAASDRVKAAYCAPGDKVNAILNSGETVAEGALLESNGDGRLRAGTTNPVARAGAAGSAGSAHYRLPVWVI